MDSFFIMILDILQVMGVLLIAGVGSLYIYYKMKKGDKW